MSRANKISNECLGQPPRNITIEKRIRQRLNKGSNLLNIFSSSFPFETASGITVVKVTSSFIRVAVATATGQDIFTQSFNQPIALLFNPVPSDKPLNSSVLIELPIGFTVGTNSKELEGRILTIGKNFIEIFTNENFGTPSGSVFIIPLHPTIDVTCLDNEE